MVPSLNNLQIFLLKEKKLVLFYGYATDGIIRSDQALLSDATGLPLTYGGIPLRVGDVNFVDQNGDGDINEQDKTIIGNPNPDYTFGFGYFF